MHQSMSICCAEKPWEKKKKRCPSVVYAGQSELMNDVQAKFVLPVYPCPWQNWQRITLAVIILIPELNNNLNDTIYPKRARAHMLWPSTKAGKVWCLTTKKFFHPRRLLCISYQKKKKRCQQRWRTYYKASSGQPLWAEHGGETIW